MLRAAVLLSLLRRLQRFSTSGHPEALVACYAASWQLPRLDFRQLADDSFQDTPCACYTAAFSKVISSIQSYLLPTCNSSAFTCTILSIAFIELNSAPI